MDECSAVVYITSTRVQRHTILWIIHAQTDAVQRSQYTVHTILQNNVLDKHLCCELLTWSVTGTEPDQVFICQGTAELSRVQGAGHQFASTINYGSMRRSGKGSIVLKT